MNGLVRWSALPVCAAVLAAAPAQTRSSEPVGDEDGFGLSLKFTGRDRENVNALSVGVKYKF